MLLATLFLFFLYLGLTVLYAWTQPTPTPITPWPLLPVPKALSSSAVHCQVDADCATHHVCLNQTCLPKLLRGGQCNPQTGQWISFRVKNIPFAICQCYNPDLMTQNYFGGDCQVNVGCGVHGQYNPQSQTCDCDPGYRHVVLAGGRLTCQKVPVLEQIQVCQPDELPVKQLQTHGFHADYENQFVRPASCVKRPCSFDALSGRPLKHGRWDPQWGCVCDPTFGLFGVVLEGRQKKYLNTEGFDACASILVQDPPGPLPVQLITYFYLGFRDPVSMIRWDHLRDQDLIPLVRGQKGPVMIRQSRWRYDYAQHYLKHHRPFRARTRSVTVLNVFGTTRVNEWDYRENFAPLPCQQVADLWMPPFTQQKVYRLLYENPVCSVHDTVAPPLFQDRIIVNPQHFLLDDPNYEHLQRFNAFVLEYEATSQRWTLDLKYPYQVRRYRVIPTNVPQYF